MNLKIQHVEVHVSSLAIAKEFYVAKLGLEVLEEIPAINLMALRAGGVRISVFGGFERDLERDPKKAAVHFVFRTDDIEATYELLKSRGIIFNTGITEAPGFVKFLTTYDPDGNKIEFGQYLRDPLEKRN